MPTKKWDTDDDFNRAQDRSGYVNSPLADHTGSDTLQRGYHVGSLTKGLVAYYPMDEGGGAVLHDGALANIGQINGATWNGSGQVGSDALSFDGTDDYVDIPNFGLFDGSKTFTLSAWVYFDTTKDQRFVISPQGEADVKFGATSAGNFIFSVIISSTDYVVSAAHSTGVWEHWIATYHPNNGMVLYQNGNQVDTNSNTGDFASQSRNNAIGAENTGFAEYVNGLIDHVTIHDRALSQPEVQALHNLTQPSGRAVGESDVPNADDSGVSRYEFENDVTDSWGSNDGTDNTSAGYVDGVFGQAKDFDGTDDYVNHDGFVAVSTADSSYSMWVKFDSTGNVFVYGENDGTDSVRAQYDNSGNQAFKNDWGDDSTTVSSSSLETGDWYHVVLTHEHGGSHRLYINGRLEDSESPPTTNSTFGENKIGGHEAAGKFMEGAVDDFRAYNTALTPVQVETLYNLGAWRINRGDVI